MWRVACGVVVEKQTHPIRDAHVHFWCLASCVLRTLGKQCYSPACSSEKSSTTKVLLRFMFGNVWRIGATTNAPKSTNKNIQNCYRDKFYEGA